MANPYAPRTTDELYEFWVAFKAFEDGARLGGTYTLKPGFHSSVNDNLARWPENYSVRDEINRREPKTVARAIDLTLSQALMKRYTARLRAAALANDPRLAPLREFYGTVNGSSVYGLAHTTPTGAWRSSSADSTHLWHLHLSIFTPYVDDAAALAGILSVLKGESLADYLGGTMERIIAEYGDSGAWVSLVQRYLQDFGATLTRDGRWGDETTSAAKWVFVNKLGGNAADYNGRAMTDWMLREFIRRDQDARTAAAIKAAIAKLPAATGPTQAQVDAAVAKFLAANPVKVPTGVRVDLGTVTGTLTGG